jgi:hypothetical protein
VALRPTLSSGLLFSGFKPTYSKHYVFAKLSKTPLHQIFSVRIDRGDYLPFPTTGAQPEVKQGQCQIEALESV